MIDWEKWKKDMLRRTEDGWWLDESLRIPRRTETRVGDAVIVQATVEPQERRVRNGFLETSEIFGRTVPDVGNPAIEWPGVEGAAKALIRTPYKMPAVRIYVGSSTREIAAGREEHHYQGDVEVLPYWIHTQQVPVGLVADHMIRYRQPDAVLPEDLSLLDAMIPFCGSLWEVDGERYIMDGPTGKGRTFQCYRMAKLDTQEERWPTYEQLCEYFDVSGMGDLEIRFDSAEVAGETFFYMKLHVMQKKSHLPLDI